MEKLSCVCACVAVGIHRLSLRLSLSLLLSPTLFPSLSLSYSSSNLLKGGGLNQSITEFKDAPSNIISAIWDLKERNVVHLFDGKFLHTYIFVQYSVRGPLLLKIGPVEVSADGEVTLTPDKIEIPLGNTILHNALQLLPPIIISAINNSDDLLLQDLLSSICRLVKEKTEFFVLSWESLFSCIQTLCESADLDNGTQVIGLEIIVILLTNKKSSFCSTIKSRKDCLHLCMKLMIVVDEDDVSIFSRTRPISEGEIIYSLNCMRKLIYCCYLYLVLCILKILDYLNDRIE